MAHQGLQEGPEDLEKAAVLGRKKKKHEPPESILFNKPMDAVK